MFELGQVRAAGQILQDQASSSQELQKKAIAGDILMTWRCVFQEWHTRSLGQPRRGRVQTGASTRDVSFKAESSQFVARPGNAVLLVKAKAALHQLRKEHSRTPFPFFFFHRVPAAAQGLLEAGRVDELGTLHTQRRSKNIMRPDHEVTGLHDVTN